MTALAQFSSNTSGTDALDTLNPVLRKLASMFFPAVGSGNDAAAIQAAMQAASDAGGGVVWLGNMTWTITSTLELDVDKVALQGHNAVLNFTGTRDIGIHVYSSDPTARRGADTLECSGLACNFATTINKGLYFYQATNPQQQNATKNWSNCRFEGAAHTIEYADNAYIMAFRNCSIGNAGTVCLYRTVNTNNCERITFTACVFFNSPKFIDIIGVSSDWYFTNCSFDYPGAAFMTLASGGYNFTGCHFEGSATGRPFEFDNSAIAHFNQCFFGMTVNADFMFTTYGNGAEVHITDCFQGLQGQTRAFSDPQNFILTRFSPGSTRQYQQLATTGTVIPNAINSVDYYVSLTGDYKIDNPINGTRNTVMRFRLSAAATRAITYGTKIKGATVSSIPAGGSLLVTLVYDAVGDIWDATTVLRGS